jgi:DNA-directed RNA polymerase subunit alpha
MDVNVQCLETKSLPDGSIAATYQIEPLERGFGITIGNSLRRVCLSHLEGTAVTGIEIEGIKHEFTVIPGIAEDVVEVILNCKSLVFSTELAEEFTLEIDFQGPGELTGAAITLPAGVELMNPDCHLATLTENIPFRARLTARRGRGYVLADEHNTRNRGVEHIPIDSAFMPVKKFSYRVEQIRIGESSEASTNKFEKLIVDLQVNGSIDPERALSSAGRLLVQKLNPFLGLAGEAIPIVSAPEAQEEETEDHLDIGIETLNLSVRAYNCLKRANKNTIRDLVQMNTDEMMGIKNFGQKSAQEVIRNLNEKGYYLADDPRRKTAPSAS